MGKYNWHEEYYKKDAHLQSVYEQVSPAEFYRALFPVGSTARKDEIKANKGNIIACRFTKKGDGKHMTHFNIGNDLPDEELQYVLGYMNAFITPISYFGRRRDKYKAHLMFAIVVDIDLVTVGNLRDLIYQYSNPEGYYYPEPNFIVNSSNGVHLYYLLKEPYELKPERSDFNNRMNAIKALKEAMMRHAWNAYTSEDPDRDAANIWQIFRAVGSRTKFDDGSLVTAYRVSDHKYDFDELNEKFHAGVDLSKLHKISREEWEQKVGEIKEKYPAYYQRVIVDKQPPKRRDCYDFPEEMYQKWYERVYTQGTEGHRYFCIKVLFANAIKCNIPRKKALADAMELLPVLDRRTKEKGHFTKDDVMAAYREAYESGEDKTDLMHRLPTDWIIKNTAIDLPKAKRNGRDQYTHLKIARAVQQVDYPNGEWREGNGRKPKKKVVLDWRDQHPGGKKMECHKDTGLSRVTIDKWWDSKEYPPAKVDFMTNDGILMERVSDKDREEQLERMMAYRDMLEKMRERK